MALHLLAAIVAVSLTKLLAHYGLLALFETRTALLLQQFFLIARSVVLAAIALLGGTLLHLVAALLVIACVEALVVHRRLWNIIGAEQAPIPTAFVNRSQFFGLVSVFDKFCAMLGSGPVILLVLASRQPAMTIAFLALAIDLVGKIVSLTVMPMGNLVAPYLSQTGDDAAAQGTAVARVVKLSSLLYCLCIGAGALLLPGFVPAVYGVTYTAAAGLALLLLVPTALENWIRGCCSPALLRNGRYRDLMRVNVVQAVATVVDARPRLPATGRGRAAQRRDGALHGGGGESLSAAQSRAGGHVCVATAGRRPRGRECRAGLDFRVRGCRRAGCRARSCRPRSSCCCSPPGCAGSFFGIATRCTLRIGWRRAGCAFARASSRHARR